MFRVIPENHKDEPYYFVQHIKVPSIPPKMPGGDANLQGAIDLGEGNFHVRLADARSAPSESAPSIGKWKRSCR